ncbi:low CO2induced aldose reductase [Acanthamoeba castellanii str. Neff]|uniref:Low CO2induced aldose reductase n=1 Tax=Acanthamoeba castellanii (strain ATCC 30010 / Neff) TaxID=1257118 RepID=L8HGC3_ACACF|nr:low CO2induced aldose reductase [Acanthamoeba castellanii str. Neff]ELR23491.1 low CO2induced aldose reductase [Acanthamoeba castellanii str. Neff]
MENGGHVMHLSGGHWMPLLGYGTWRVGKGAVGQLVDWAIAEEGYRHIDCASLYNNEHDVGRALARLLQNQPAATTAAPPPRTTPHGGDGDGDGVGDGPQKVARDELFITSKLWNTHHRRELVFQACRKSLQDLRLEYLDLYLMHWPVAMVPNARPPLRKGRFLRDEYIDTQTSLRETWLAMEELVARGWVKSIGVSNFTVRQLEHVLSFASIPPAVNQIEMHPYLLQPDLLHFCRQHNIVGKELLADETVVALAERKGRTPAQVVLRWGLEHGAVVIPRTEQRAHMRANADVFSFSLAPAEMAQLDALHRDRRYITGWVRDQWTS